MPHACKIFEGQWFNSMDSTCEDCPSNCRICEGGVCSECKPGFWINPQSSCVPCSGANVLYCYPTLDLPTACFSGFSLMGKDCIEVCKEGYLLQGTSCVPCDSTCLTCEIQSIQCTSCLPGDVFYLQTPTNKRCIVNKDVS